MGGEAGTLFAKWNRGLSSVKNRAVGGGGLNDNPGHIRPELRLLGEGGRRSTITHRYRCDWDIGNKSPDGTLTINGGPIVLEDRDELQPGETTVVRIRPIAPELWTHVHAGMVINCHEGPRIVGIAKVLEVRVPRQQRVGRDPRGSPSETHR